MKLKIRLDAQSIQEFSLAHVEKLVFGLMILVLFLFVYSALGRERLSFTPADLTRESEDADRYIETTEGKSTREVVAYGKKAPDIKAPIEEQHYQHLSLWDPPLFDQKRKRGDPPLFPVEELRAAADRGPMPMTLVSGFRSTPGRMVEGVRWAVITGIIPDAKQREEALKAFAGTQSPRAGGDRDWRADVPQIVYYRIERAEVGDQAQDVPPDQLAWTPLHVRNAMKRAQEFRGSGREVVPEKYILNVRSVALTFPLPPIANHIWGEEVAHPPKIPLRQMTFEQAGMPGPYEGMHRGAMTAPGKSGSQPGGPGNEKPETEKGQPAEGPEAAEKPGTAVAEAGKDEPDEPFAAPGGQEGFGPVGPMAMPGMEPGMMEGPMPMPMPMPGMEGMEFGPGMPGMPEMAGMPMGRGEEIARVKLFRFFDFSVEPGKRYKYRVKLLLSNPNFGLPTRFLEREELARIQWLETDWSEPSNTVTIPRDARILAGPVKPSAFVTGEPKATVGVAFFDFATGTEQFEKFEVIRGQWLNFYKRPLSGSERLTVGSQYGQPPPIMPGLDEMMTPEMPGMPGMPGKDKKKDRDRQKPKEKEKDKEKERQRQKEPPPAQLVDYLTETLVLDMRGGNRLPGRDREATEPGRLLLLDPEGKLVALNELDHAEEFQRQVEPSKKQGPAGYYPEMPMGPEMMMTPEMGMPGPGNLDELMMPGAHPKKGKGPRKDLMEGPGRPKKARER